MSVRDAVISWGDLGWPTEPGVYTLDGVGEVHVAQIDIDQAETMSGNPLVEIFDTSTFGSQVTTSSRILCA